MVRMKAYSIFIIYTVFLISIVNAKTEITQEGYFCRQIEMSLAVEFLREGKSLPRSFDEMQLLQEIVLRDPESSRSINEMVIVPHTPKILFQEGISYTRSDRRLFAISRKPVAHSRNENDLGRYSVWISKDEKDVIPDWMSEVEARLVINQLKNFDPNSQPMAFKDVEEKIREKKQRTGILQSKPPAAYERPKKVFPKLRSNDDSKSAKEDSGWIWWLCVGSCLLMFLSYLIFRSCKRKK